MDTKIPEEWLQTGFPRLLWDALQLCGYDRRPVYVLHPHKTATDVEFSAEIKIVAKPEPTSRPWTAIGLRVNTPELAVEIVAREALVCFRGFLPEMKQRATFYLPFKGSFDHPGGSQDPINEEAALAYETRFAFASEMVFSALADDYRHVKMELQQVRDRLAFKESQERRMRRFGTYVGPYGEGTSRPKRNTARSYLAQFQPIQPAEGAQRDPSPPPQPIEVDPGSDSSDSVADPPYSPTTH